MVKEASIAKKMIMLIAVEEYLLLVVLATYDSLGLLQCCLSFEEFKNDFYNSHVFFIR